MWKTLFTFLHGRMVSLFKATNISSLLCILSELFYTDKKLNRSIKYFNSTINKLDLMDVERILHLTAVECTILLLSRSHETFTQIDPYWPMKQVSKNSKDITETVLSDHITIMLEFNNKEKKS